MKNKNIIILGAMTLIVALAGYFFINKSSKLNYQVAKYHPIHFKPLIDMASDEQCLKCHSEIYTDKVKDISFAGVKADESLAWYQTLETYQGKQETFHFRHLKSPYSQKVMNMRCNTCHQGNDPREEAVNPPTSDGNSPFTLRKMVNPKTCLLCHGQFPNKPMGLPTPWHQIRDSFNNNCLTCHTAIRTTRHQVNFLNAENIEKEGQVTGDSCYGCHGGRAWYNISYPYPRHKWPSMSDAIPDWAVGRPTESEKRFLIETKNQTTEK